MFNDRYLTVRLNTLDYAALDQAVIRSIESNTASIKLVTRLIKDPNTTDKAMKQAKKCKHIRDKIQDITLEIFNEKFGHL